MKREYKFLVNSLELSYFTLYIRYTTVRLTFIDVTTQYKHRVAMGMGILLFPVGNL